MAEWVDIAKYSSREQLDTLETMFALAVSSVTGNGSATKSCHRRGILNLLELDSDFSRAPWIFFKGKPPQQCHPIMSLASESMLPLSTISRQIFPPSNSNLHYYHETFDDHHRLIGIMQLSLRDIQ
ncbi:hypothetical protein KIN20_013320 [Parelaphostrongylus tenuis]|uniref:Uncharacterized protein n=1 Tax=Parelaphostrongylus tenuis TaxID=148309 RepID=A0AAD5QNF4_PARTN|nr:hypothetical protein KIN20_013320 [Parelaphostrongylus tenuis]